MRSRITMLAATLRDRRWRHMLFVSCMIAIGLPVYISLAIHPGCESLIVRQAKEEATRLTAYLVAAIVQDATSLSATSFNDAKRRQMGDVQQAFGLFKLNVFSAGGTVVYSTDPGAIGTHTLEPAVARSLATGQPVVKVVLAGRPSADHRPAPADLIECYVPILKRCRGDDVTAANFPSSCP